MLHLIIVCVDLLNQALLIHCIRYNISDTTVTVLQYYNKVDAVDGLQAKERERGFIDFQRLKNVNFYRKKGEFMAQRLMRSDRLQETQKTFWLKVAVNRNLFATAFVSWQDDRLWTITYGVFAETVAMHIDY